MNGFEILGYLRQRSDCIEAVEATFYGQRYWISDLLRNGLYYTEKAQSSILSF